MNRRHVDTVQRTPRVACTEQCSRHISIGLVCERLRPYTYTRNTETPSGNRRRRAQATSRPITYFDCVFAALVIQHAVLHCHLWPVRLYCIFPH
jgi:hypothetical protein